jgi:hypothetical protein
MRAQAVNNGARFRIEHAQVGGVIGISVAGERKLLPDHEAHFVAHLEEGFFLNRRPTPHAQQIHVRLARRFEQRLQRFARHHARKYSALTKFGALGKNRAPVDFERDRGLERVLGNRSANPTHPSCITKRTRRTPTRDVFSSKICSFSNSCTREV